MSVIRRRVLLAAAAAVPAAVVLKQVADAAPIPPELGGSQGAPDPVRAPVASLARGGGRAGEIGGVESASEQALGEVTSALGGAPAITSKDGQGALTRLPATTAAGEA